MKKKGRGSEGEEAKERISKKSLNIVMAAVIVGSVMAAFMPAAAAAITSFTITPNTATAGEVAAYSAVVNSTTEWTTLNITIPARFGVETPTGGELIAKVDLWDSDGYYGNVTFTANSTDKVDVEVKVDGDTATATGIAVDYSAGGKTNITSPFPGAGDSHMNLTLPTDSANGSLNLSLPMGVTNVSVVIEQFVQNPATAGDYVFTADGVSTVVTVTTEASGESATGKGNVTFSTSDAGTIENLTALNESDLPEENPSVDFLYGLFSFNITGLTQNQTVNITITLPNNAPVGTQYWKYGPTPTNTTPHWYQVPVGDDDGDNVITITLKDGGLGDSDLTQNGTIVDPGGPVIPAVAVPGLTPIGIVALVGLLAIVAMNRIRKRRYA